MDQLDGGEEKTVCHIMSRHDDLDSSSSHFFSELLTEFFVFFSSQPDSCQTEK